MRSRGSAGRSAWSEKRQHRCVGVGAGGNLGLAAARTTGGQSLSQGDAPRSLETDANDASRRASGARCNTLAIEMPHQALVSDREFLREPRRKRLALRISCEPIRVVLAHQAPKCLPHLFRRGSGA